MPTDQVPVTEAVAGDGGPVEASKPRRRRWLWRSVLGVAILLLLALGYYLVTLYQVWSTANQDQARPADAIVVLGAAQYDGRPAAVLASRLDHVVQLYKAGYADTIVVTGGKQPLDRFTEAAASAKYLEARGVPASAILQAPIGHNSFDSISAAAQLLEQRGKHTVLMVSDPYHSLRIAGHRRRGRARALHLADPHEPDHRWLGVPPDDEGGGRHLAGPGDRLRPPEGHHGLTSRAGSAVHGPGEARLACLFALRGWCNRQHSRFWPCRWGFESSPPSVELYAKAQVTGLGLPHEMT